MNNVLELKGKRFVQASKTNSGGGSTMNSKVIVTCEYLQRLIERLKLVRDFWSKEKQLFDGVLVSVFYNKVVAKPIEYLEFLKERNQTLQLLVPSSIKIKRSILLLII